MKIARVDVELYRIPPDRPRVDGCCEAPKRPGLGFTFDEGKLEKYVVE